MKTKRLATVILFACVMLMTAHEAQAFYNPSAGRWLSRDPIGEVGGEHLYAACKNDMLNRFDLFGLFDDLTDAEVAGQQCDGMRNNSKDTKTQKPKKVSKRCQKKCDREIERLKNESAEVKRMLNLFPGDCKKPSIKCSRQALDKEDGYTEPDSGDITINAKDGVVNYEGIVLHELTHALQLCGKPRPDVMDCGIRMRMEFEAYFCGGNRNTEEEFRFAIGGALASSCRNGPCDGKQIKKLYEELEDWYSKNKDKFCTGNRPSYPSTPRQ